MLVSQGLSPVFSIGTATSVAVAARAAAEQISQISEERPKEAGARLENSNDRALNQWVTSGKSWKIIGKPWENHRKWMVTLWKTFT